MGEGNVFNNCIKSGNTGSFECPVFFMCILTMNGKYCKLKLEWIVLQRMYFTLKGESEMKELNEKNTLQAGHDQRKKETGRLGEALAASMLEDRGYEILTRNYRCRFGEIDIIAVKKKVLCFVEVKTRTGQAYGEPAESVTRSKQQKLRQTAMHFLNEYEGKFHGIEFQVVEILVRHLDGLDF